MSIGAHGVCLVVGWLSCWRTRASAYGGDCGPDHVRRSKSVRFAALHGVGGDLDAPPEGLRLLAGLVMLGDVSLGVRGGRPGLEALRGGDDGPPHGAGDVQQRLRAAAGTVVDRGGQV